MVNLFLKVKGLIKNAGVLDEKAQTLVEYGLVVLLISVAFIGVLMIFGEQVRELYQGIGITLSGI